LYKKSERRGGCCPRAVLEYRGGKRREKPRWGFASDDLEVNRNKQTESTHGKGKESIWSDSGVIFGKANCRNFPEGRDSLESFRGGLIYEQGKSVLGVRGRGGERSPRFTFFALAREKAVDENRGWRAGGGNVQVVKNKLPVSGWSL